MFEISSVGTNKALDKAVLPLVFQDECMPAWPGAVESIVALYRQ